MLSKKTWKEFRETGLLMFVNTFLQIFGWSLVAVIDDELGEVDVFPARTKFRGFDVETQQISHKKLAKWIEENIKELNIEANS